MNRAFALWIGLLLCGGSVVEARLNVVTLPGRDSVQLTIYNSVDLTMVRETRVLTFREGLNRLEFSWANTLIDPTSVELRAVTHADQVEVLDVSFPPRTPSTLEWRIKSEFAGEVTVEIRYFTSGISWKADYVAEAARNEKSMTLSGFVRVNNNSGEDYENAEVRLVVGTIRLVEQIAHLARERDDSDHLNENLFFYKLPKDAQIQAGRAFGAALNGLEEKEVIKERLSEYFLYTVGGRDTIPNGWAKRLPSFTATNVPIVSFYKYEKERFGDLAMRYYRFRNDKPGKLGNEPLPDGLVKAFRFVSDDRLYAFIGGTETKYIPIDEQVDLALGSDDELRIAPRLMNWEKTDLRYDANGNVQGWTVRESWEIDLQNSKEIDALVDLRRNSSGDWDIKTDDTFEKIDATTIKFTVPLKPLEQRKLVYQTTTRHGSNVTR